MFESFSKPLSVDMIVSGFRPGQGVNTLFYKWFEFHNTKYVDLRAVYLDNIVDGVRDVLAQQPDTQAILVDMDQLETNTEKFAALALSIHGAVPNGVRIAITTHADIGKLPPAVANRFHHVQFS